jgi:hypothetical protein
MASSLVASLLMALRVEVVENFALTAEGDYAAIAAIGAILQQSLREPSPLRTDQCARKPANRGRHDPPG